jgi:hypothetical protein
MELKHNHKKKIFPWQHDRNQSSVMPSAWIKYIENNKLNDICVEVNVGRHTKQLPWLSLR